MAKTIRGVWMLAIASGLAMALACGEEVTTPVDYGQGLFQFQLPGEWQSSGQVGKELHFARADNPEVRVSVSAEVQNWGGGAITQRQLRSALGSRFNRLYGNTQSVVTLAGLAMVTFPNKNDGARHWVVAKPYSVGYVQYADVGLHLPDHMSDGEAQQLVDELQPKIGDALFRH